MLQPNLSLKTDSFIRKAVHRRYWRTEFFTPDTVLILFLIQDSAWLLRNIFESLTNADLEISLLECILITVFHTPFYVQYNWILTVILMFSYLVLTQWYCCTIWTSRFGLFTLSVWSLVKHVISRGWERNQFDLHIILKCIRWSAFSHISYLCMLQCWTSFDVFIFNIQIIIRTTFFISKFSTHWTLVTR